MNHSLGALTAAALLLPGLAASLPASAADEDSNASLQYGRYQEGPQQLRGVPNNLTPLHVDTLRGSAALRLDDDNRLLLSYGQDTWAGATPIATAPLAANTNRPVQIGSAGQLITVGASPMLTGRVLLDARGQVLRQNADSTFNAAPQLTHTLVGASPESRQQGEALWQRRLADGRFDLGGSLSSERDTQSWQLQSQRRWDSEDRNTNIGLSARYGESRTLARFNHDAAPYITRAATQSEHDAQFDSSDGVPRLNGRRQDLHLGASFTQVLDRSSLFSVDLGLSFSQGYLGNPYKAVSVLFADPASADARGIVNANLQALLEQRPNERRQIQIGTQWLRHFSASDGVLRLAWQHQRDDWGSTADTLESEWRQPFGPALLIPRLRYYSQSAARFYTPYLVSPQAYRQVSIDAAGTPRIVTFDPRLLPTNYSSDSRLGGYGSLSLGLGFTAPLGRGVSLEGGIDIGRQAGALKAGGGSKLGDYADFRYTLASLAVRFELENGPSRSDWLNAPAFEDAAGAGHSAAGHEHGHDHHLAPPAGVLYAHTLPTGQWMFAYRQQYSRYSGPLRHGDTATSDAETITRACPGQTCYGVAQRMGMQMHMLELMVGLSPEWTLMLMPQYQTMSMDTRLLNGASTLPADQHLHTGIMENGGFGDTAVHLLTPLASTPDTQLTLALGVSLPTGASGDKLPRSHQQDPGFLHYDMQNGSGTWDFLPALTWQGQRAVWQWGAQLTATLRLQSHNNQGYALGNGATASAWLGRPLAGGNASLRLIHSAQAPLRGAFNDTHPNTAPADYASNSGVRSTDLALGYTLPLGGQRQEQLSLEWQRPLASQVHGYQLARQQLLTLGWAHHF